MAAPYLPADTGRYLDPRLRSRFPVRPRTPRGLARRSVNLMGRAERIAERVQAAEAPTARVARQIKRSTRLAARAGVLAAAATGGDPIAAQQEAMNLREQGRAAAEQTRVDQFRAQFAAGGPVNPRARRAAQRAARAGLY